MRTTLLWLATLLALIATAPGPRPAPRPAPLESFHLKVRPELPRPAVRRREPSPATGWSCAYRVTQLEFRLQGDHYTASVEFADCGRSGVPEWPRTVRTEGKLTHEERVVLAERLAGSGLLLERLRGTAVAAVEQQLLAGQLAPPLLGGSQPTVAKPAG